MNAPVSKRVAPREYIVQRLSSLCTQVRRDEFFCVHLETRKEAIMDHLLTLDELTPGEIDQLYTRASAVKAARGTPAGMPPLVGQTLALLFEKPSLRTRVSFEVAARELGAESLYLSPQE